MLKVLLGDSNDYLKSFVAPWPIKRAQTKKCRKIELFSITTGRFLGSFVKFWLDYAEIWSIYKDHVNKDLWSLSTEKGPIQKIKKGKAAHHHLRKIPLYPLFVCLFVCFVFNHLGIPTGIFSKSFIKILLDLTKIFLI